MLADDFFLIAWDTTGSGKPRLNGPALALGLAGALIAELVLEHRVLVRGVSLQVTDPRPVREHLADRILADIGNAPQHTDVRTWLAYLARRAVADVTARMARAGLLDRETTRMRRRRPSRYFATDFGRAVWPSTRLRLSLARGRPLSHDDMVLAALLDACGMTDTVVEDPDHRQAARRRLAGMLTALPEPVGDLTRHVRAAVGDAVLTYRS
ncbi:GOLPH3/VPS74 family protein [Nonomuraea indica]|uniref:GPP34 family phosphoprotein n=1 Tax=Nonomuraea indica TaxID=1581193 RepID=A0ABW7ZYR7_9ACTN|nr:GPP34 family phosphoprotein [Nonomuraea indica]